MPDTSDSITLGPTEPAVKGMFLDPSCLPQTKLPISDELKKPKGEITPAPQHKVPRGLNLGNREITLVCPDDGSFGDPVTITAYTFTAIVYFSAVPSITTDVLDYIANNELEASIEEAWHNGTLTTQLLKSKTGMPNLHGKELIAHLQQVQKRLDDAALLNAKTLLHCKWCNTQQEAVCEDSAMVRNGEYDGHIAVYHAVVEEGQYCSELSQEDANEKALAAAESMLNCFYINDLCTATCETRPDRPMEDMEHVPNDLEPLYPGLDLRVGTYVVEAGLFISYTSKDDANSQACEAAYSMLNCWYPNLPVEGECERNADGEIEARNNGIDPELEPPKEADIFRKSPGQTVYVPSGFFTSSYSTELATQEAEEFAASLLECCFINDEFSAKCDVEVVTRGDGVNITLEPEPDSPMPEVVVPRGMYTSCVSKDEANQFAIDSMTGMLSCRYCNGLVYPTCVPDWVIEGIDAGDIKLPLTAGTISYNGHTISTTSLPANATSGLPAGAVCDPSAVQAQNIANSLAQSPIATTAGSKSDEYCTYYNDLVIVACQADDPYGQLSSGEMGVTPDGMPYIFISLYNRNHCLSETLTYPAIGTYFRIEAGMWSDVGSDKKNDLNERALRYALSLTQCMFENPPIQGWCGAPEKPRTLCDDNWVVGKNTEFGERQLVEWANTRKRPVYVPRGVIALRGIGGDYARIAATIMEQAVQLTEGQILCAYCNTAKTYNCGTTLDSQDTIRRTGSIVCPQNRTVKYAEHNVVYNRPGLINPCFVIADTPGEADAQAAQLAMQATGCDEDTFYEYVVCMQEAEPTPTPGGGGGGIIPPGPNVSPTPTPSPTPFFEEAEYPYPIYPNPYPDAMEACSWRACWQYSWWYFYFGGPGTSYSTQSLLDELVVLEKELEALQNDERL